MRSRPASLTAIATLAYTLTSAAFGATVLVEWNHFDINADALVQTTMATGDDLVVVVSDSCSGSFTTTLHAEQVPAPQTKLKFANQDYVPVLCDANPLPPIRTTHTAATGGYVVAIAYIPNSPVLAVRWAAGVSQTDKDDLTQKVTSSPTCINDRFSSECAALATATVGSKGDVKALKPAVLMISLGSAPPVTFDFAGGITGSSLTNPKYFLGDANPSNPQGTYLVLQDTQNQDSVAIGLAAFIHTSAPAILKGSLALSLGTGVSSTGDPAFYVGPSWRLGGQFFVTAGAAFGPIQTLPSGTVAGVTRTNDANLLSNLPTRRTTGWFIGLSYSIFGNARSVIESLFKPIGAEPAKKQ